MDRVKLKPVDVEAAKRGYPVCTRDGRDARIIAFNAKNDTYPIIALIQDEDGNEYAESFTIEGRKYLSIQCSDHDLFMKPKKKKLWIRIRKQPSNEGTDFENHETSCAYVNQDQLIKDTENNHYVEIEIEV